MDFLLLVLLNLLRYIFYLKNWILLLVLCCRVFIYFLFCLRFELLYGITEVESAHLLDAVSLTHGMLEKERDQDLNKYLSMRCELNQEVCQLRTLAEYIGPDFAMNDQTLGGFATRDMLLDMLSDARTVAPMVLTGRYHASVNPQSYFYVFGHTTASRNFIVSNKNIFEIARNET